MKVLVFTTLYPNNVWPNHGVFIKERMKQFAMLDGCAVKVVAPVPYFPPIKANWRWRFSQVATSELRDGIEVYHPRYFMTPKWGMLFYGVLLFFSALRCVKRLRKEFDFDLIDAHFVYPDGFAAILLGKFFNKPVVVSARGSDINLYATLPMIRRILSYTLSRAKRVVAVSQALKEEITKLGVSADKVVVVSNGVDVKRFYPLPKEQAQRELQLPRKRIILSAGNLTANKGFDLLVRAFSRLADDPSGNDLHLVIVGEGTERRPLERMVTSLGINNRVKLVGAVAHERMHLWYNAADIFCLVSEREGLPNVLLEALACGVPVVATQVGGIPEILSSDELGLLTGREESKVADAIRAALAKTWRADALIEHVMNLSWDDSARTVRKIFQGALQPDSNQRGNGEPDREGAGSREMVPKEARVDSLSVTRRIDLP
jgi:glycosyltransferase involved in cell wall biosynthesis